MSSRGGVFKLSANIALSNTGASSRSEYPPVYSSSEHRRAEERLLKPVPTHTPLYKAEIQPRASVERKRLVHDQTWDKQPAISRRNQYEDKAKIASEYKPTGLQSRRMAQARPNPKEIQLPIPKPNLKPRRTPTKEESSFPVSYAINQFEDKPISQLKKQQFEIVSIEQVLVQCKMGCGRSFNQKALQKHQKVCKKVFQSKRKQFDSEKQRLVAKEQMKLQKDGARKDKFLQSKKAKEKKPKWKAQSQAFRGMLKQERFIKNGKEVPAELIRGVKQAEKEMNNYVKCQYCGRSFNQKAAQRHIPFCEKKAREAQIRKPVRR